jgi:hypothetical protein
MTRSKIAIVATLATFLAVPAFATDQDTAAVTINSGQHIRSGRRSPVARAAGVRCISFWSL